MRSFSSGLQVELVSDAHGGDGDCCAPIGVAGGIHDRNSLPRRRPGANGNIAFRDARALGDQRFKLVGGFEGFSELWRLYAVFLACLQSRFSESGSGVARGTAPDIIMGLVMPGPHQTAVESGSVATAGKGRLQPPRDSNAAPVSNDPERAAMALTLVSQKARGRSDCVVERVSPVSSKLAKSSFA